MLLIGLSMGGGGAVVYGINMYNSKVVDNGGSGPYPPHLEKAIGFTLDFVGKNAL